LPRITRSCERCNDSFRTNQSANHVICANCRSQDKDRKRSAAKTAALYPPRDTKCEGCGCGVTLSRGGVRPFCDSCKAIDDRWRKDRSRNYRFAFIVEFERKQKAEAKAAESDAKRDAKALAVRAPKVKPQRYTAHIRAYNKWLRAQKRPWLAHGLTKGEQRKIRMESDPGFAIKVRLSSRLRDRQKGMAKKVSKNIHKTLKAGAPNSPTFRFLGYSSEDLMVHLGRQFTKGMSWGNMGDWHIDHRRPLAVFDLEDEQELREAWSLTNLQPLWAWDNMAKGASTELLL